VTPAFRLPLRRLPRPSVVAVVGLTVLVLVAVFSFAGLPAPGGIAGGGGPASQDPNASQVPSSPPSLLGLPGVASKRDAIQVLGLCEHGPRDMIPAAVVFHGSRDEKVIALTFDDGWGGRSLRKILHILQDRHVNATFFPVGQAVRHDPTGWKKIAAAGYPIADHTYDHATLAGECYTTQRLELTRARNTYEKVLGITSLPVMRPPGGEFDAATRAAATAAGEPTLVLWDVDTNDWRGLGMRQVMRNALAGGRGSIVVLHTSSYATVRALPRIIHRYRERGFTFVTINELLGIDGPVPWPTDETGSEGG
jgi:peptidoglycan/xylan/chitin deacetylase (PgdA/CDA1 family)